MYNLMLTNEEITILQNYLLKGVDDPDICHILEYINDEVQAQRKEKNHD